MRQRAQVPHLAAPQVPDGERIYAIGDIHGRDDLLLRLHGLIRADLDASPAVRPIAVYLGDYVDRGPGSFEVLDHLVNDPLPFESVALKGNHEDMMLSFLDGDADPMWLYNGGIETLASYRIALSGHQFGAFDLQSIREGLLAALPESHRRFLNALELSLARGDYFFVHAGVRPGRPLDQQDPREMMWIRGRFLGSQTDFGKRVVHGHTITAEPEVKFNRIGIDTGAFATGRLTCLVLERSHVRFLQT
jgi:diadenosine tetraphosphatase ApaH/serine/threonine PP2A family protein phosphatase